jgi:hypothetical protein
MLDHRPSFQVVAAIFVCPLHELSMVQSKKAQSHIYIYIYIYIYICCEESLKTPARIGGYAKILGVAGLSEAWSSLDTSGFSSVSGKVSWAKREASGDATFGGRSSYPG